MMVRRGASRRGRESGQITPLVIGFTVISLLLIVGTGSVLALVTR